ncbi:SDR family oxidoreductase [Spirochaetota bacterium]
MILLAGATGSLGSEVAKELAKKNKKFKCLVRETSDVKALEEIGALLVYGDVRDRESLKEAIKGVTGIISTFTLGRQRKGITYRDVDYEGNKNLIELLKENGGGKYVFISSLSVNADSVFGLFKVKHEIENLLKSSGLDYTIFKPSGFFTDFTMTAGVVLKRHIYPAVGGRNLKIQGIYQGDIAFCVVDSFSNEKASKQVVPIGGPEVITAKDAAAIYSELLERKIRILPIPAIIPRAIAWTFDLFTGQKYKIHALLKAMMRDSISDNTRLLSIFDIDFKYLREYLEEYLRERNSIS